MEACSKVNSRLFFSQQYVIRAWPCTERACSSCLPQMPLPQRGRHAHRRLVERVSADEVTVDYANDIDTAL